MSTTTAALTDLTRPLNELRLDDNHEPADEQMESESESESEEELEDDSDTEYDKAVYGTHRVGVVCPYAFPN